ncbi:hypothetical protein F0562_015326 [Nyssa sinensis]|uniref:Uncharacterized protein n=1 Tax=Nyssa sinensis TaxID=561372 RepID=A0A5J4ZL27_9ASTE|nr:hypothetical protein F0562_015326 [Nyssa sinensis]
MFVKGKELWGHLDESSKAPTDPKELSSWEGRDAKITSWLLNSVESHMVQSSWVSKEALVALHAVHSESQRDQFLMKLRPEFESARAGLINRTPVPSLEAEDDPDLCHSVIVARKLGTLQNIAARNSAINSRRKVISLRIVVYALKIDPLLLFILLFSPLLCLHPPLYPLFRVLLPTLFQSSSPAALHDVREYDGEQHIQIADGSTLPITAVGNLGSSFTNVFVSPNLSTNLISVGHTPRVKPGIVYQRRRLLPLLSSEPPPDPVLHEPRRSTRVSRPPDWYGFSSALQTTLDTTFVPK